MKLETNYHPAPAATPSRWSALRIVTALVTLASTFSALPAAAQVVPVATYDTSFGTGGTFTYDQGFRSTGDLAFNEAFQRSDGFLVFTGQGKWPTTKWAGPGFNALLSPSGVLDTTYGNSGFFESLDLSHRPLIATGGVLLPNDEMMMAGILWDDTFGGLSFDLYNTVQKITAGGVLAGSWGSVGGGYSQWEGTLISEIIDLAHQPSSGRIVVAGGGLLSDDTRRPIFTAVSAATGNTDAAFHANSAWLRQPGAVYQEWRGVQVAADEKMLVWGGSAVRDNPDNYYDGIDRITMVLANGSPAPSFNGGGILTISAAVHGISRLADARLLSSGKVLLWSDSIAVRLNADGSRDMTYGTNGRLVPGINRARVVIRDDGGFIAADGDSIFRFLPNGTPDLILSERSYGNVNFRFSNVAADSQGRLLLMGQSVEANNYKYPRVYRIYDNPPPILQASHTNNRRTTCDISASINTRGLPGTAVIRYGLSPAFGQTFSINSLGLENGYSAPISQYASINRTTTLTGLVPGNTYYYSVRLTTTGGVVDSITSAFATPSPVLSVVSSLPLVGGGSFELPLSHGGTLGLGTTTTGTVVSRDIVLRNTGNGKLWIDSLTPSSGYGLSNPIPISFSAVGGLESPNAGGLNAVRFSIRLLAAAGGTYNGTLVIRSDDPFHTNYTINLTGQVDPAVQTITWNGLASSYARQYPVPLTAVSSSGQSVVYTVISGPGVIANGVVNATGNGNVVVRATVPATASYLAASPVDRTLIFRDPEVRLNLGTSNGTVLDGGVPVDFGSGLSGVTTSRTVVIRNLEALAMNITSMSSTGGFTLAGISPPLVLAAMGGSANLIIHFPATGATGLRTGSVTLETSFGTVIIPLTAILCDARNYAAADTSFDADGKVVTPITGGGSQNDVLRAVGLQQNGKILVAGYTATASGDNFLLMRYLANGTLDPTFGTAGKVTTDFNGSIDQAYAMAVRSDDFIVLAGVSGGDFAVAMYQPDGSVFSGFNGNGRRTYPVGNNQDIARGVAIQQDGRMVVAGYTAGGGGGQGNNFAVIRINEDSSLNPSFGSSGKVVINVAVSSNDEAYAVALDSQERILLGGMATGTTVDFALVRLNGGGILDTTFDADGIVLTDIRSGAGIGDQCYALAIQPDGKIIAAGTAVAAADTRQGVVRYMETGALDTTFGTAGKFTPTPLNGSDTAYAVKLLPDGKILTAGNSWNGSVAHDFMVSRLKAGGSLDPTFGVVALSIGSGHDIAYGMALQSDCRIILAGSTQATTGAATDAALMRFGQSISSLEAWRFTHFGSPANSGNGADNNDFDRDGLPNLIEYAFALDPTQPSSAGLPQWERQLVNGALAVEFSGQPGVTYAAERSTSLTAGSWTTLPELGDGDRHIFSTPATAPREFLRFRVTNP